MKKQAAPFLVLLLWAINLVSYGQQSYNLATEQARIVVSEKHVEVFVETLAEPVLAVDRLASSKSKKVGLWTGNGSSAMFLVVMPWSPAWDII